MIPFFPRPRNVASSTLFPFAMITEEQSNQVSSEDSSCIGTFCACDGLHALEHLGVCGGVRVRSHASYYKDCTEQLQKPLLYNFCNQIKRLEIFKGK